MSIARPDTSRRREPVGPGRCFGTGASQTVTHVWLAPLIALITGATLLLAPVTAAHADEAEGPIRLSNEDVERLHAQSPKPATSAPPARATDDAAAEAKAQADAKAAAAEIAANQAMEASLRKKLDLISQQSMGSLSRKLDSRIQTDDDSVPSLDAEPARKAPVTAPAAPAPTGDGEPSASLQRRKHEPACVYSVRGRLIYAPADRECAPIRATAPKRSFAEPEPQTLTSTARNERDARNKKASVGCVYGSRGQLLYSSPGVECAG